MTTVHDSGVFDTFEVDAASLGITDAAASTCRVKFCYKRIGTSYMPWVAVAQSAALKSIGIDSLGLYTLRNLTPRRQTRLAWAPASRIDQYGGTIVAEYQDRNSATAAAERTRLARSGLMHLMEMKFNGRWTVVDGQNAGPPFIHMANDARNIQGYHTNTLISENGVATASRVVPAADFSAATSINDLRDSELLVSYGERFWRVHDTLGQRDAPIVLESVLPSLVRLSLK